MALEEEVVALRAEVAALREALAQAQARIAELERRKTPPPAFVRANTPTERPARPRRKRPREHNAGRPREEPTHIVYHAVERCADCGYLLRGQSVARTRQVIDLPEPAPVQITEHRVLKRRCPVCDRWWTPRVDFSSQVSLPCGRTSRPGQGSCAPAAGDESPRREGSVDLSLI